MADKKELLPCPFCGAKPPVINKRPLVEWPWQISCEECGAMTDLYIEEAHAVDAWNRRSAS